MKRSLFALVLAVGLGASALADAGEPPVVRLSKPRISLADLLPEAPAEAASVDMGASPPPFGSRLFARDELRRALDEAHLTIPKELPMAVRVVRQTRKLSAPEIQRVTQEALASSMPRGAVFSSVRAPRAVEVAAGWDSVTAVLPRPPHRTGTFETTVILRFLAGSEQIGEILVPVELRLTQDALRFDVSRGATLTLVVRRGLVEVNASAIAGADADIGSILQVTIRPSGRTVRARLVEKDTAELVDGP